MSLVEQSAGDIRPGTIKIIGIGQGLRGDDGAGTAAVRYWNEVYNANSERSNIQMELAELPGLGLLDLLEEARYAILVDAVQSEAPPGTIHQFTEEQLDMFGEASASAHGWGVAETLALGHKLSLSHLPEKIFLLGIEAGQFSLGEQLSPEVQRSVPEAARLIEQMVLACLS
jgi:hydrogenase maturation protease